MGKDSKVDLESGWYKWALTIEESDMGRGDNIKIKHMAGCHTCQHQDYD